MNISDFETGDVLLLTYRSRRGEDKRVAQVVAVNPNDNGLVHFAQPPVFFKTEYLDAGQGVFKPGEVYRHPYALVGVRTLARLRPRNRFPITPCPRPGDRSFDLMC